MILVTLICPLKQASPLYRGPLLQVSTVHTLAKGFENSFSHIKDNFEYFLKPVISCGQKILCLHVEVAAENIEQ